MIEYLYSNEYPYSNLTQRMLDYLPSWMKIRMERNSQGDNPTNAAQFLNIFGLSFEDMEELIKESIQNYFIDTANIDMPCLLYKIDLDYVLGSDQFVTINYFIKFVGQEKVRLVENNSLQEFYISKDIAYLVDKGHRLGYIKTDQNIEYILVQAYNINDVLSEIKISNIMIHHIWNAFDEIGLLIGLPRLKYEDNASYKNRLKSVFAIQRGATKSGVQESLANLLDIKHNEVVINELSDLAFKGTLLDEEGKPTEKMREYVNLINKRLSNTWDEMQWDEAYWKSVDDAYLGLEYLPHIWDVKPKYCPQCQKYFSLEEGVCPNCQVATVGWTKTDFQSGIGDSLDLAIKAPIQQSGEQEFEYYIKAHASINKDEVYYPEHTFTYKVYARGYNNQVDDDIDNVKYTILAGERHNFTNEIGVEAKGDWLIEANAPFDETTISQSEGINELKIVDSQKIVSPSADETSKYKYLKIVAKLEDSDTTIDKVTVTWKDTNDATQTLTLDSTTELEGGVLDSGGYPRTLVTKDKVDVVDGFIVLAQTGFYTTIDSDADWQSEATYDNNLTITNGTLRLKEGL